MYETIRNQHDKFTGGESLDDLVLQAEDAVERLVWLHLEDRIVIMHHQEGGVTVDGRPRENGGEVDIDIEIRLGYHVVLISHGLCISEMIAGLLRGGCECRRSNHQRPTQRTCQYWLDASIHSSSGE